MAWIIGRWLAPSMTTVPGKEFLLLARSNPSFSPFHLLMSLPIPSDDPIGRVQGEVGMRYVPARAPPYLLCLRPE
jgi:hypothetical protein